LTEINNEICTAHAAPKKEGVTYKKSENGGFTIISTVALDLLSIKGEAAFDIKPQVDAARHEGLDVIDLSIGDVQYPLVHNIQEIIQDAGQKSLRYGNPLGEPGVRETISHYLSQRAQGLDIDPQNVYVSIGAKGALTSVLRCNIQPGNGDEIICFQPYFPSYLGIIQLLGARVTVVPLNPRDNYRPDYQELERSITSKTKAIIVNSPHNPTGSILTPKDYRVIGDLVANTSIMIVFDEVYHNLVYDGTNCSALSMLPDLYEEGQVTVIDSLSKSHALPGLRLGFGVTNSAFIRQIHKIQTHFFSCPPQLTQAAAKLILDNEEIYHGRREKMKQEFRLRRDLLVKEINDIDDLHCSVPEGAIYVYPRIDNIDASLFQKLLLELTGVACLDSTGFGDPRNAVRLAFSTESTDRLIEALDRIKRIATYVRTQ
jgi:aspartate/methionine/tyrosine aminotransferase